MLENLQLPQRVKACKVKTIADSLDQKDRDILLKAVADPAWAGKALSRSLKELGIEISDTTILRHRENSCPCN
jgi:hypothetical protein